MTVSRTLAALAAASCLLGTTGTPAAAGPAQPNRAPAATPLTAAFPDFDGDGAGDLGYAYLGDWDDNRIRVEYGSGATGMITAQRTIGDEWGQLGQALLPRDLNADGYTDLAFTGSGPESGAHLCVLYGGATGLSLTSLHCSGVPRADVNLEALALVELPRPRLVVGTSGKGDAPGRLFVYDLGPDGRPLGVPRVLQAGRDGVPGLSDARGSFGRALASSGSRLFVGVPDARVGGVDRAGAVVTLTFSASGAVSGSVLSQSTQGVPGAAEKGDGFGSSLAAAEEYLAVGTPGDAAGNVANTGTVQVFALADDGTAPRQQLSQASAGVPGVAERSDQSGAAVAIGTLCAGVPGVVVGGPNEVVTEDGEAQGSAWVIPLVPHADCPAVQLWEGHGLGGRPQTGRSLGVDVGVLRGNGETADRFVVAGNGLWSDMSPIGVIAVWSAQTRQSVYWKEEFVNAVADR